MSEVTRMRARTAATIGVAAALAVGGVAAAQNDSQGGSDGDRPARAGKRPPPPGPMMGAPLMKGLTYGELHVQSKDGEAETIRLDQGKILAVDESSITLSENDGSEVTVALDGDTDVLARPGSESGVGDLAEGDQVLVSGPEGEAARSVVVLPKKGDLKGAAPGGQLPPPPPGVRPESPGGQMGS